LKEEQRARRRLSEDSCPSAGPVAALLAASQGTTV